MEKIKEVIEDSSEVEKIVKPLAFRKHMLNIDFTNPEYYPEELHKDLFGLLRTPLKDGSTAPLIKLPEKQEQSKYWFEKINLIGAVILISVIALIGVLLQETDVLNLFWQQIISVVGL